MHFTNMELLSVNVTDLFTAQTIVCDTFEEARTFIQDSIEFGLVTYDEYYQLISQQFYIVEITQESRTINTASEEPIDYDENELDYKELLVKIKF